MNLRSLLRLTLLVTSSSLLAQTTTLRATGRLVVVDVVVTDASGHPVPDLPQSAFTVLESKAPQRITSFEEHKAQLPGQPAATPVATRLPPGTFTNVALPPTTDSLNVLLLDTLNTPLSDQAVVRAQLLDYIKHARPGVPIAIFGLSSSLQMLQGFTSDPSTLRQIVEHQSGKGSRLLEDPIAGAASETLATQLAGTEIQNKPTTASHAQTFLDVQKAVQQTARVRYTLDAMDQLARYLANLPGRKNLIWFSGSFPLSVLPNSTANIKADRIPKATPNSHGPENGFAAETYNTAEFRETATLLARSRVAVYPISAHGLQAYDSADASSSDSNFTHPTTMMDDNAKFTTQIAGEQETMLNLAQDTGGQAYVNTNGLTAAVAKAITAGSSFYTLAYTPPETHKGGEFRPSRLRWPAQSTTWPTVAATTRRRPGPLTFPRTHQPRQTLPTLLRCAER